MKIVIFDWDNTLADMYSQKPWDEAVLLLKALQKEHARVVILTARPGKDPRIGIFSALAAAGVILKQNDIIWVGKSFISRKKAAIDKANVLDNIQQELGLSRDDMLFVDDAGENIQEAKRRGYIAMQVPDLCWSQYAIESVKNQARTQFFQSVQHAAHQSSVDWRLILLVLLLVVSLVAVASGLGSVIGLPLLKSMGMPAAISLLTIGGLGSVVTGVLGSIKVRNDEVANEASALALEKELPIMPQPAPSEKVLVKSPGQSPRSPTSESNRVSSESSEELDDQEQAGRESTDSLFVAASALTFQPVTKGGSGENSVVRRLRFSGSQDEME